MRNARRNRKERAPGAESTGNMRPQGSRRIAASRAARIQGDHSMRKETARTVSGRSRRPEVRSSVWFRIGIIFLVAAVIAGAAIGIFYAVAGPQGFFLRRTAVMKTGNYAVDGAMMSYYYYDLYYAAMEEDGDVYRAEGLDPARPLQDQVRRDGQSWYDYFMTDAIPYVQRILVFAEAAYRHGDAAEAVDGDVEATLEALQEEATTAGQSLADYITERYGQGVQEQDVRRAVFLSAYAYRRAGILAATVYTDAELEDAYQRNPSAFVAVDYIVYSVRAEVPDDATEEEMREAYLKAETEANRLAGAGSEGAFAAHMANLIRAENPGITSYRVTHMVSDAYVYGMALSNEDEESRWLSDQRRAPGDTVVLGTAGDYRVLYFRARHERLTYHRADMRQILYSYTDYQTVLDTRAAAEAMREEFLAGTPTEEEFAALAQRLSADAASVATGGLYTDIGYGELEKDLSDWLLDAARIPGDTAVIQSVLGYHVLYFVGFSERAVWEEQAAQVLQDETYTEWLRESGFVLYNSALTCLPRVTAALV